jgi:hypothetical protein
MNIVDSAIKHLNAFVEVPDFCLKSLESIDFTND